ncbi:unnamed protein product, partial [Ceratitis capitata]
MLLITPDGNNYTNTATTTSHQVGFKYSSLRLVALAGFVGKCLGEKSMGESSK